MPADSDIANRSAPAGIISAHLDDAVLSCTAAITPGSVVVTAFASGPSHVDPLPPWDAATGHFKPGDDVMTVRGAEDDDALACLGATGRRLSFWEVQYRGTGQSRWARVPVVARFMAREPPVDAELAAAITDQLQPLISSSGLDVWFVPLGIGHSDHRTLGAAWAPLARSLSAIQWYVYEDLPYALERPAERDAAKTGLEQQGFALEPIATTIDRKRKRAAIEHYRSQLAALGPRVQAAIDAEERLYRLLDR